MEAKCPGISGIPEIGTSLIYLYSRIIRRNHIISFSRTFTHLYYLCSDIRKPGQYQQLISQLSDFMKKLFILLALLSSLWACKKNEINDPPPPPTLDTVLTQFTVWDGTEWSVDKPKGILSVGAEVRLYPDTVFYNEGWVKYSAITNENGVATFKDLPEGEYYMLAFKGVIHQGEISNNWDDGDKMTYLSDTLFQSQAEIDDPNTPRQPGAAPGDLRFKDVNSDGVIDKNDLVKTPCHKIVVKGKQSTMTTVLLSNPINHLMTFYKTEEQVDAALAQIVQKIAPVYQRWRMLDGVLSDDADCTGFADWCDLDNFRITPDNPILAGIFKDTYDCILQLNRLNLSLNNMKSENKELRAQITVLRGILFSDLLAYFGEGAPITDKAILPRTVSGDKREIMQAAFFQFGSAVKDLPITVPAGKNWHMTQDAGRLLAAKCGAQGHDNPQLLAPIFSGNKYTLVTPSQVFVSPNNSEIMWDMASGMTPEFKQYFTRDGATFFPVARYTEAVILYGLINANNHYGSLDSVNILINLVRANRQESAVNFSTYEDARTELKRLQAAELYREGYRYRGMNGPEREAILGPKGYNSDKYLLPIPTYILRGYPNTYQNWGY